MQMTVYIKTNVSDLLDRLNFVSRVVGRKGSQYSHALIEANEAGLFVRSFNGLAHAVARLGSEKGSAAMLCDIKPIIDALGAVSGPVDVEVDFPSTEVRIRGPVSLNHRCEPSKGYADFPEGMSGGAPVDDADALQEAIRRVSIPIDPSHPRSQFRGLYMEASGSLELTAVNGPAGTHSELPLEIGANRDAIVPVEALDALRHVLQSGGAKLNLNERTLVAGSAKAEIGLSTVLLVEKFPNYRSILVDPDDAEKIVVDREQVLRAAKICGGYSDEYATVYVCIADGEVEVRSMESEYGKASYSFSHAGDELDVVLKTSANRLREAVEPLDCNKVEILIPVKQQVKRVGFRPLDDDTAVSVLALMVIHEGELE